MRMLEIGGKALGDGCPCFITFEAGPTHDGVETAIRLVREAAQAGADAIKFQIFDADKLVQDKKLHFQYSVLVDKNTNETREVSEPLYDILKRRQLTHSEWRRVKLEADSMGIAFFATVGYEEDILLLQDIGCHSVKIASADVNHFPFLRLAAKSGMNVQIDTGSSELAEIVQAISFLESQGCKSIIIHQCPTGYPARVPSICLNMIQTLKESFPRYPIAYSDHTPDADMDIAAVALGANLIEKTITFDRCTPSVEHIFSLEPPDMRSFIKRIRDVELALGSSSRTLTTEQKLKRSMIRRGAYLVRNVAAGDVVKLDDIIFRRPCRGLSPDILDTYIVNGCFYAENLVAGSELFAEHISQSL